MASAESQLGTLHLLCQGGNLKKVQGFVGQLPNKEALLEALRAQKGASKYTPLHEAVSRDRYEVVEYLLALAGEGFADQCRSSDGSTLLHVAASAGFSESVQALLRHKVDVRLTDSAGKTALYRAEQRNVRHADSRELVRLLKCEGKL